VFELGLLLYILIFLIFQYVEYDTKTVQKDGVATIIQSLPVLYQK
jgi:hypothetical protein